MDDPSGNLLSPTVEPLWVSPASPLRSGVMASRAALPDWPRLMSEDTAALYLSIGTSTLRVAGPKPKRLGRRVLYDIRDLDRWADGLDGQPLDERARLEEAAEVERRFLEKRRGAH